MAKINNVSLHLYPGLGLETGEVRVYTILYILYILYNM